jgi:hypothetical protein
MVKIKLESDPEWRGLAYDWPPDYKATHYPKFFPCMAVMTWRQSGVADSVEVEYIYPSDFQTSAKRIDTDETPVKYINPIPPEQR